MGMPSLVKLSNPQRLDLGLWSPSQTNYTPGPMVMTLERVRRSIPSSHSMAGSSPPRQQPLPCTFTTPKLSEAQEPAPAHK